MVVRSPTGLKWLLTSLWVSTIALVPCFGALDRGPNVDMYNVVFDTPSATSLGAMPIGNGRTAVNLWVDASSGDLMLLIGLADAFDENSNLLKLGIVRVGLDPPYNESQRFNQTLVLSTATIELQLASTQILLWVDANTSDVRVRILPSSDEPVGVSVTLDHQARLNSTINAAGFGNGWGGSSGSFCFKNGTFATFVGIYPDVLLNSIEPSIVWYHRNDPSRSDMYGDAMKQQGLDDCGESCWDPLTNRSFGAALVGDMTFAKANSTSMATKDIRTPVEFSIAVLSAQTDSAVDFESMLDVKTKTAISELGSSQLRSEHIAWWAEFWNRSYFHVTSDLANDNNEKSDTIGAPGNGIPSGFTRYDGLAGIQSSLIRNSSWPHNGETPGNCSFKFSATYGKPLDQSSAACATKCAEWCSSTPGCRAFALSVSWGGGFSPQLYTEGLPGDHVNDGWVLFLNASAFPPTPPPPPPPPPLSDGFVISRQNILMRYMDLCSSNRIGGGSDGNDYFALKYNGGILTSEPAPLENSRSWGPGQWWQNLRLPYYAMLAEGGADMFKPLLRWYASLLPMAERRTSIWFNRTDSAGRNLTGRNVNGAWFMETLTEFGTYVPSEKGYWCTALRNESWTVDWAGNRAINIHREGSVELLMLALDYWDYTNDSDELEKTIIPLASAVMNFVDSYYDFPNGTLSIWPTQSLEGYRPGGFPPTHENCVQNDMPWVAGLHAVLPRLLRLPSLNDNQTQQWMNLKESLPPLPVESGKFTAAQTPYPPEAVLGGTEQPFMYAVHPYRLSTVLSGGELLKIGQNTIGYDPSSPTKPISGGIGWQQGVMNLALLGLTDLAQSAVVARARTSSDAMRFPSYLPSMQDFRPNEDHLSNMRSALQYMLVQHQLESNNTIGLFPAWPCLAWSTSFKLMVPQNTVIEGQYNHSTARLRLSVTPASRKSDIVFMSCVNSSSVVWDHL